MSRTKPNRPPDPRAAVRAFLEQTPPHDLIDLIEAAPEAWERVLTAFAVGTRGDYLSTEDLVALETTLARALPDDRRRDLTRYSDARGCQTLVSQQAAFAIGFELGRGGAR